MNFLQQLLIQFLHYHPTGFILMDIIRVGREKGKDDDVAGYIIFLINTLKRGITPVFQVYSSYPKFLIL